MRVHHFHQTGSLVPVPVFGPSAHVAPFEVQGACGQRGADHLHAQPTGAPEHPGVHVERVEEPFPGEYYGVCSCLARSLECVRRDDAAAWRCPRREAEEEVARNLRSWVARLRLAALAGSRIEVR